MELDDDLNTALAAAARNESWGWNRLYRSLAPAVTGYLRAQGAREPEDLTAEVFVQAVKNIHRFQGDPASFRSWIFCIAHNKLIDDVRYRSRRPVEPIADAGADRVSPESVEDQVLGSLAGERVITLIGNLTPDQRNVVFLRILGELTIEEVARALNKPVTAVKALQRRGLAAIRRELSSQTVSI
ncbi:MAG: RNA polymerase sigma factor [Actinomycetota bacterium]